MYIGWLAGRLTEAIDFSVQVIEEWCGVRKLNNLEIGQSIAGFMTVPISIDVLLLITFVTITLLVLPAY